VGKRKRSREKTSKSLVNRSELITSGVLMARLTRSPGAAPAPGSSYYLDLADVALGQKRKAAAEPRKTAASDRKKTE
jgi:hypothetical protein